MENTGYKGANMLARVMDKRTQEHSDKPLVLDFAEIKEDMSLLSNTFGKPIPKADYSVCRQVALGAAGDVLCGVNAGGESGQAFIPETMRKLKPGDRVLIAWVQDEPVVIDIVYKANRL